MVSTGRASSSLAPLTCLFAAALPATPAWSHDEEIPQNVSPDDICRPAGSCGMDHNRPEHGSVAQIGAKLSDPTFDVWAMQFNFQTPVAYEGDLSTGDPK